jgi:hypothetical protein
MMCVLAVQYFGVCIVWDLIRKIEYNTAYWTYFRSTPNGIKHQNVDGDPADANQFLAIDIIVCQ